MSNLKLEILSIEDQNKWDSVLQKSRQSTLFNTYNWSDILKKTFDIDTEIYSVFKDYKMIGGILLFYKRKYGLKVITKIPLVQYNGILLFFENNLKEQKEYQYINEVTEIIVKQLKKEFKFCNFSLHPTFNDIRIFKWNKWIVEPNYTYITPLNSENQIWENFSSSLRRKISRAEEQKYKFVEENNIENLISLHEESYRKNHLKPILDRSTFIRYCNNVKNSGLLKVFSIYGSDNKLYSSRAVLVWDHTVYDWIAGTSTDSLDTNASHLLVWEILKKFSREGCKSFDFMGANTPKIIDFKKSFGGKLTSYYDIKYYSSSFIKTLFKINDKLISFKRNL